MAYEQIKTLKTSERSIVYLVYDTETQKLFVEKHLVGYIEVYQHLMALPHSYLPRIIDVQFCNDKTIVLEEYISGGSLSQIKPTELQLNQWMLELCDVLDYLHSHQIIHRDIKPSNLLLGEDGHIRLIDFDAARQPKEQADQDTRLLGTKGYAPPEQYGFAQTDQRTDLYAVGITWNVLLGDRANKKEYRSVLQKCTDLNPQKRYTSAKQLTFAWKTRKLRCVLPLASLLLSVLLAISCSFWYITHQSEITESRYPDEDLLFYATEGDYVIADIGNIRNNGAVYTLETDMDNDGEKDLLELYSTADGEVEAHIYTGVLHEELFSHILSSTPVYLYLDHIMAYDMLAYDPFWPEQDNKQIQITCLDLDKAKKNGLELLVSIGDGNRHQITVVFKVNTEGLCEKGVMWGSSVMKVWADKTIDAALLPNIYQKSNRYRYTDGVEELSCVNYDEYWHVVEYGISYDAFNDLLKNLD